MSLSLLTVNGNINFVIECILLESEFKTRTIVEKCKVYNTLCEEYKSCM